MVDYLYSVAIQANLFHHDNNMVDKSVWHIIQRRINECSLYIIIMYNMKVYIYTYIYILVLGGIDKYSTTVFLKKILRYNYIPTILMVDFPNHLSSILQSS